MNIDKELILMYLGLFLGLISYPLFLYFGFQYILSLGLSIGAAIAGVMYLLVAFFGGIGWVILVCVIATIIFSD